MAPVLLFALIHPSAWKVGVLGSSPGKFQSSLIWGMRPYPYCIDTYSAIASTGRESDIFLPPLR